MKANFRKSPLPILAAAASALLLQACAGAEIVIVSTLVANPASVGLVAAATPIAAEAAGVRTGLFDGLEPSKGREEEYAKLDSAAKDLSEKMGTPMTRSDVMLLAVLNKNGQAGLKEFARESKLTRVEVMSAVARLEKLHLIWLDRKVTESGPFTAALTPMGSFASTPVAQIYLNRQFLDSSSQDSREIRIATNSSDSSKEFN